ncbi:MAG: hypothetical protein K2J66_05605 [Muribaculaceae bacterium]|nr:hypothetical protein [Muribaculaceae bacterium]
MKKLLLVAGIIIATGVVGQAALKKLGHINRESVTIKASRGVEPVLAELTSAEVNCEEDAQNQVHRVVRSDDEYGDWVYLGNASFFMDDEYYRICFGELNYTTTVERRQLLSDTTIVQYRFGYMFDVENLILDADTKTNRGYVAPQQTKWAVDSDGYVDSVFTVTCDNVRFSDISGGFGFTYVRYKATDESGELAPVYWIPGIVPIQIEGMKPFEIDFEAEPCYDKYTREAVIKIKRGEGVARVRYKVFEPYVSTYTDEAYYELLSNQSEAPRAVDEIRIPLDSPVRKELTMFAEDEQGRFIASGIFGIPGFSLYISSNIDEEREWTDCGDATLITGQIISEQTQYTRKCLTPADAPGSVIRIVSPFGPDSGFAEYFPEEVFDNDEYYLDINMCGDGYCYPSYRPLGKTASIHGSLSIDHTYAEYPNSTVELALKNGYTLEQVKQSLKRIEDNRVTIDYSYTIVLPSDFSIVGNMYVDTEESTAYMDVSLSDDVATLKYAMMPLGSYGIKSYVDKIINGASYLESTTTGINNVQGEVYKLDVRDNTARSGTTEPRKVKIDVTEAYGKSGYYLIVVPFGADGNYLNEYAHAEINKFKYYGTATYEVTGELELFSFSESSRVEKSGEIYKFIKPVDNDKASQQMYFNGKVLTEDLAATQPFNTGLTITYAYDTYPVWYSTRQFWDGQNEEGAELSFDGETLYVPAGAAALSFSLGWVPTDGDLWIRIKRPETSGSEEIEDDAVAESDADAPVEYYDMQGRRVVSPSQGIYIRRQGSAVSKELFR